PPGDGDVEAVVRRRLLRPATPLLEGRHQGLFGVGDDEVDDAGGATGDAGAGAGEEVLAGGGAHEGQLHVGVGIDAAGHHIAAAHVDDVGAVGLQVRPHGGDGLTLHEDVGGVLAVGGDDGAAAKKGACCHGVL